MMTSIDFEPLTVKVELTEDPPGVFRVGKSRVLLELVLRAFLRGETPESIVRSYRSLQIAEVYSVVTRYLANPGAFDQYLHHCDEAADGVRQRLEAAGVTNRLSKEEIVNRGRGQGLAP